MDHCVETLLACGEDIEILLVDDGSTKGRHGGHATAGRTSTPTLSAPPSAQQHPRRRGELVSRTRAALLQGGRLRLLASRGDVSAHGQLRSQLDAPVPCDMVVANRVYDKRWMIGSNVGYGNVRRPNRYEFGWDEVGTYLSSQYLLMHSVYYRTEMLRKCTLSCPSTPSTWTTSSSTSRYSTCAPCATSTRLITSSAANQSVNEKVMMGHMDQQLRYTRQMIDNVQGRAFRHLRHYGTQLPLHDDVHLLGVSCHARGRDRRAGSEGYRA